MNILLYALVLFTFIVSCTNKTKQEETPPTPVNNAVGINDTLGLFLYPEFPIYSTKQKQVTFIMHNNSGTHIGMGGNYSYTYEDEKGIWRDVPMQLIVFMENYSMEWQQEVYQRRTGSAYTWSLSFLLYSKEI